MRRILNARSACATDVGARPLCVVLIARPALHRTAPARRDAAAIGGIFGRGAKSSPRGSDCVDPELGADAARPRRHHDHALRQIDRFEHRMGDEDDGLLQVAPQLQQVVVEPKARDLVERRERLVHQQNVRIGDERARQRDPHLHAAGQFARIAVGEFGEADVRQRFQDLRVGLRRRHAAPASAAGAHFPARSPTASGSAPGTRSRC